MDLLTIDEIVSIEQVFNDSLRYDITVEDNHNFFANGILVHNCQNLTREIEKNQGEQFEVSVKLDGCLHKDTLITTEFGQIPIGELVKMKNKPKILTYNFETLACEYDEIINTLYSEISNDWYIITLENGTKITITGNHPIFDKDKNAFVKVSKLTGNENLMVL